MDEQPASKRWPLGDWGALGWGVVAGLVILSLLVAAYAIGLHDGREERPGTATPPVAAPAAPPSGEAAATFAGTCGACHTLAAAGTSGAIGPNLDDLAPTADQVLAAIENGGLGTGAMPAGLLEDDAAAQVAEYVAASAGG